jgi:Uma2 family endonuclease
MTLLLSKPKPAAEETGEVGEQRVTLHGIQWETYERLLKDLEDSSAPRLTYDRGVLEIMSPLPVHEANNRNLQMIAEIIAEEWNINIENLGSMTMKRHDIERGFEPDSCFYIRNADQVAGRPRIDLEAGDPAPDLVIEVDFTSPSLAKLPLYAEMGVSEVWRLSGTRDSHLSILVLEENQYREKEQSAAFPRLSREQLATFVTRKGTMRRLDWIRYVREWARRQAAEEAR